MPERIKDPGALHLAVGGDRAAFRVRLDASLAEAVPVDLDADQPAAWEDNDPEAELVAAHARIAELEALLAGGDGACQSCRPLRDTVREWRMREQLRRSGPFAPNVASVVLALVTTARATRTNGRLRASLLRPDVAELANVSQRDVTRAYAALEAIQTDPDLAGALPFTLVRRRDERGHDHVDLVPEDGETWTVADACLRLSRLARPEAGRGGNRAGAADGVPHRGSCDCGGRTVATQTVCNRCGEVRHRTPPRIDSPAEPAEKRVDYLSTGPTSPLNVFRGDSLSTGSSASPAPPSGGTPDCVWAGCTAPAVNGFVCADHLGDDDHPPDPAPWPTVPGWQPPPLAPAHHIAPGWQQRRPPDLDGRPAR